MPRFSDRSKEILSTCHQDIQKVLREAIQYTDVAVIEGVRDEKTQNKYFEEGKSMLKYPYSKHNRNPSQAVDVCPYEIGKGCLWDDKENFYYLAGVILTIAKINRISLRWGGHWHSFKDLPHFEKE